MAQIPKRVMERISKELGRFQKILQVAKDRDVNEADTVTIVTDILASLLGYDKYAEITSEFAIRSTFCDLAVKIDGALSFLIEVKAIGLGLKESHLRQVVDYGAKAGVRWVVLTNGISWSIHQIRFECPVSTVEVCEFNLLDMGARNPEDQERLFLLCREGISKAAIQEFHERRQLINRFTVAAVLLTQPVQDVIKRELRRLSPSIKIDAEEIERLMKNEILKREAIDCEDANHARKLLKKASSRTLRKHSEEKSVFGDIHDDLSTQIDIAKEGLITDTTA